MSMFFVRPDFLRLSKSLKTDEDLQYSVETSRSISMWQSWDKRLTKPFKLITHFHEIPRDCLDSARLFDLWSIIWSQSATSHLFARTRSFHGPTFIRPVCNFLYFPWWKYGFESRWSHEICFRVYLQLFKLQLPLRRSYLHSKVCISVVHIIFMFHFFYGMNSTNSPLAHLP